MAENENSSPNLSSFKIKSRVRYFVAVLGSVGLALVYGMKVNLSVAIVSMVNHTAIKDGSVTTDHQLSNTTGACNGDEGDTSEANENGPFLWSTTLQGTLLSAYFWGYLVSQIPGGRISEIFSAKWVMCFSVSINIICTLLTPVAAKLHYGAMLILRIAEGLGGGMTFPAMHVLLSKWAPPEERSVMSSIVYAGTALGTVLFMLASGVTAADLGWEAVFYTQGGVSILWIVLWIFLVYDTPQQHKLISEDERNYIVTSLHSNVDEHKSKHLPVPWKSVLTSKPFWAILVAHVCSNWGWYMVLTELPFYLKQALKFKMSENALLTALPFFCMWIFSLVLSKVLDTLRAKKIIHTTTARKIATLIASVIPAICFIILTYIGCRRIIAVVLMTITVTSIGGMFCGFLSNHIDIAPNFAGTLVALTNTVATVPGIVVPVFIGKLLDYDPSMHSWQIIFWTTVVLYVIEIIAYTAFGSGEEQSWNKVSLKTSVESQPLKSPNNPDTQDKHSYDSTNTATVDVK